MRRHPKMKVSEGFGMNDGIPPEKIEAEGKLALKASEERDESSDTLSQDFASLLEDRSDPSTSQKTHSAFEELHDRRFESKTARERVARKAGQEASATDSPATDLERLAAFSLQLPGESSGPTSTHEVSPSAEVPLEVRSIVDQILVADQRYAENQEVRILLKDSFLAGTEIRISSEGAGITVTIVTNSHDSLQFLSEHSAPLESQLRTKLAKPVQMEVQLAEAGDRNQGRSRQRRSVVEEWES
jgi:type III secretion system needle length determinant